MTMNSCKHPSVQVNADDRFLILHMFEGLLCAIHLMVSTSGQQGLRRPGVGQ